MCVRVCVRGDGSGQRAEGGDGLRLLTIWRMAVVRTRNENGTSRRARERSGQSSQATPQEPGDSMAKARIESAVGSERTEAIEYE